MSTYAIGDVQGCYTELIDLLNLIQFDKDKDVLWFAGDLVNRGKNSLEVLRFIKALGNRHQTVLGNHDFHLLAVAFGAQALRDDDTCQDVLNAPDRNELLHWLRHQKLLHVDRDLDFALVHAGISPQWDLILAENCAKEVETILQSERFIELLPHLYGDTPIAWEDNLKAWERYRFIVNVFARMRYCDEKGYLNLKAKGPIGTHGDTLYPWFDAPERKPIRENIAFGHWAALNGITNKPGFFAVDTGCAWGHQLTALRLEDQRRFSVIKR